MIFQQLVNGLALGSMYALLAVGFSLICGIMRMITFAHGEVFMIGAYAGLLAVFFWGNNLIIGFLVAVLVAAALGLITERLAFRPFIGGSDLTPALITIGLSIMLQDVVLLAIGAETKPLPVNLHVFRWEIGNTVISGLDVLVLGASLLLIGLLHLFTYHTRWGLALQATAQNRDAISLMGIRPTLIMALAFAIASALAGAAGILVGIYYNAFYPRMGVIMSLKALAAATLGGIGNPSGAIIGGLALGVLESFAGAAVSTGYKDVVAFAVLIAVLLIRPEGLLGKAQGDRA